MNHSQFEVTSTNKQNIYTVDSFANGIAFGSQKVNQDLDLRKDFSLRLEENGELVRLRSRYLLHPKNPLIQLETYLASLSRQGILSSATIILGVSTDPFHPFQAKFDASMRFLELFTKYQPGLLIVQTRSPLLVIAMPVFTKLKSKILINFSIESCCEESIRRYTPGFPNLVDRLKAIKTMQRFKIDLSINVAPLIPYGVWKSDSKKFASILCEAADHIRVSSLIESYSSEANLRRSSIAKKLAHDRAFHWLRSDSAQPLLEEIHKIAPEKLEIPKLLKRQPKQHSIFAA